VISTIGLIAFGLGPRPDVDDSVLNVELPDDLDRFVATAEARFSDLTPGADKTIVWADSAARTRTPLAVVYLHGFSATRQEVSPLSEDLARSLEANVFLTRLTGHGRGSDPMAEASMNDWLNDTAEAIAIGHRLGERVILVGTSTGATLAAWAAARPDLNQELAALVLISPNFRPADPSAAILTWPWGGQLAQLVIGPYREWHPTKELQRRFWTTRYPTKALLPMAALVRFVADMDLRTVRAPTLILYSSQDQVVSVTEIVRTAKTIGRDGARVIDVGTVGDPANHVLAGDILSPGDTDRLQSLIEEFLVSVL
jgi:pimeloyl-ACP methyl ester carboxylesterase